MKIKQIILTVLILIILPNVLWSQISISGAILNAPKNCTIKLIYTNPIELRKIVIKDTIANSEGLFTIQSDWKTFTEAQLLVNNQIVSLFLCPKYNLSCTMNYNDVLETIYFKGVGADDNNYIIEDSKNNFDSKFAEACEIKYVDIFIDTLNYFDLENQKFTSNYIDNFSVSASLKNKLNADLVYKKMFYKYFYEYYFNIKENKFERRNLPKNYFDELKNVNKNITQYWNNSLYQSVLEQYVNHYNTLLNDTFELKPIYKSKSVAEKIWIKYNFIQNTFENKIRDYQLCLFIHQNINKISETNWLQDSIMQSFNKTCTTSGFKNIIQSDFEKIKSVESGKTAFNFAAIDDTSKALRLNDFLGKTVYLIFWNTYTAQCRYDLDKLKKISEQNTNDSIVFLTVCLNDDKEKWYQSKMTNRIKGYYVYADEILSYNLSMKYNINTIPSYFIIDKFGKFYTSKAPAPSPKLINILTEANRIK